MTTATQAYNLQAINPRLSKEWHPAKNGALTPRAVAPMSGKKAWWICSKAHEWEATISNRSRGRGCPYCSGHKVGDDNCLGALNPSLAKQWHPTKNGSLTPKDVTPHSHQRVWWICDRGHEWEAFIHGRSSGSGCPYCARERNRNLL